jgi:CRP/FNR family transcriptional regulator, cyclic AMP receptor protein
MEREPLNPARAEGASEVPGRKVRLMAKRIPFLAGLSDRELRELEQLILVKKIERDTVILWEEDTCRFLYIVFSGKVKVVKGCADGNEHILAIHKKGDFFGEMAILDGKTVPARVVAMEECEVGLLSKEVFDKYLLTNPKVLREIISVFCARLRQAWLKINVLAHSDAQSRVRAVLELIGVQHGVMESTGMRIPIKLTHKDIGMFSSLSRETVTRQLLKLVEADEVQMLPDKQILLKHRFLEAMRNRCN